MASGSAYDGDEAVPLEDCDPESPETAVLVPPVQSMRYPTLNMDGTAPLPSAPARGELVYAEKPSAPAETRRETGAPEPINLVRFCELLQEHAEGSVQCANSNCAMLFGSTGAGKSTLLHLLAGAKFSREAVEVGGDDDEFGADIDMQLVTDMKIPGCVIGQSRSSTTRLLNSHFDSSTNLMYVDTPGFNNVGDEGDDDTTIDAANSAAIMGTIRSCGTLRIVFLISVKDELNNTRGGQIKKLFEVMHKLILDAKSHLPSVLMLFTHCEGFPSAEVVKLLNKIGRDKVLPEALMPFLKHAIALLNEHKDNLLIRPAEDYTQQRMDIVRSLLCRTVVPMVETSAALQCPLSEEVLKSLVLACAVEHENIVKGLSCNRVLTDARPHLQHLYLLYDALRLPDVERSYFGALEEMVRQAEQRRDMALQALKTQSFQQVRSFLSIFNCDLDPISHHVQKVGPGDALKTLKTECLSSINSKSDGFVAELEQALVQDNFDAVAAVLTSCEQFCLHLNEYVLPKNKDRLTFGVIEKTRAHTERNRDRALEIIKGKMFNEELASLLDAIQRGSQNETMLRHVRLRLEGEHPAGENDYNEVTTAMDGSLIKLAHELRMKYTADDAVSIFEQRAIAMSSTLAQIDDAGEYLKHHLTQQARDAMSACREAFTKFKDDEIEHLRLVVDRRDWESASVLFKCLKNAENMGSMEEKHNVEKRLGDIQNLASAILTERVKALKEILERDEFKSFIRDEVALGSATLLPEGSVLSAHDLQKFKSEHAQLLETAQKKFKGTEELCRDKLKERRYAEVAKAIIMMEKMAEAQVDRENPWGCVVPTFNQCVADLLQHVQNYASAEVDECKLLTERLCEPGCLPTEKEVVDLKARLQQLLELKKNVNGIKGNVPMLNSIAFSPADLFPSPGQAVTAGDSSERRGDATPRGSKSKRQPKKKNGAAGDVWVWDVTLCQMLVAAEKELTESLEEYAEKCRDRCFSSLDEEPKPRAEDVVAYLNTLTVCKQLDPVFAATRPETGAHPFAKQRQAVSDAVKSKFSELRDACGRDVRANQMASAQAKLNILTEMLVLRGEFSGDAITMDDAVEELYSDFQQRSGAFAQSVAKALNEQRFVEVNKILLGYRSLPGAAEQEEYNNAITSLMERGNSKCTDAMQIISTINDDARGRTEFPPSVEEMAAALRWIRGARCLGEGDDPVLPHQVFAQWDQPFHQLNIKLTLIKARESKLDEWKFVTVEEMHRRLGQLLLLRFPEDVSETIGKMKSSLSEALEKKVATLGSDVDQALERGEYLTIDLIFQEVKSAKDADSYFVSNSTYNNLITILENYLNRLTESIKNHYIRHDIQQAHVKQEHLWKLEKAAVAKNHVARAGLDALAEQKKKSMITRSWLVEGPLGIVSEKLKGFENVDPVTYQCLVNELVAAFDADIKRLRKVETKEDVLEVKQVVGDLPRFATLLNSEQTVFKKHWDQIWNSLIESVRKKSRLACGTSQDPDISDSISFLQAARKLLLQQKAQIDSQATGASTASTAPAPTLTARAVRAQRSGGIKSAPESSDCAAKQAIPAAKNSMNDSSNTEPPAARMPGPKEKLPSPSAGPARSSAGMGWGRGVLNLVLGKKQEDNEKEAEERGREEVDFDDARAEVLEDVRDKVDESEPDGQTESVDESEPDGQAESLRTETATPIGTPPLCIFQLPFDEEQLKTIIEKLDGLLGQIEVDTDEIDSGWVRLVEKVDFMADAVGFEETLRYIRLLKLHAQAIIASGEYGYLKKAPTADRAISKLSRSALDCLKALDANRPEECVTVLHNLDLFCKLLTRVIDDDMELQNALMTNFSKHLLDANEWVTRIEKDFAEKGAESYAKAEKTRDSAERKKLLSEVNQKLEQRQRLQEKLKDCGLREDTSTDAPLVSDIKRRISEMESEIRNRLRRPGDVKADFVADTIHTMYVTAFDLGQPSILKHAEACIDGILHDCKGKTGLGLQEIGTVLERDLPHGSEIIASIPQFAEVNLIAFQNMTSGKTLDGTVEEFATIRKLSEAHKASLLHVVKEVFASYERAMSRGRFSHHSDVVRQVKIFFDTDKSIPGLIGGVFGIWSLASISEQCPTPRRPLATQVLAVIRLLALDKPAQRGSFLSWMGLSSRPEATIDASHLAQIKTGQGKSVVLGTLATVLCIAGFQVDCVCYSAYLSERDAKDFEEVFKLFGVKDMVNYGTFQQLSERLINADGDVRSMTRDVMLGSKEARVSQCGARVQSAKGRILLVDEVDVFFSSSFYGETYDAVVPLQLDSIAELQKKAWVMRSGDTKLILPALHATDAYKSLMRDYPRMQKVLEGQVKKMIRDLDTWKNGGKDEPYRHYKVIDGVIAYKSGVCYDPKISFGYVTLWTYFNELERSRVADVALNNHLGLMINCGQFSYAEIPKRYNLILGVTGTLVPECKGGPHPLGTFEQEIIRDDYKIKGKTELPSVFGERNLTFRENDHVSVQKTADEFNNAIGLEVAKALEGRAVLVFFESEAKMEAWQASSYGQRVPAGTLDVIKSDTRNITLKVRKATHSGQVTLLTREHGRGLDFLCSDKKVDELGGLHVVQTFLSEELSEEIQIRGRTARQKNKGSFQMILLAQDLEKFAVSAAEIGQKEKGIFVPVTADGAGDPAGKSADCTSHPAQTMYEFLHAKRALFLEQMSATRREAVWCAKALHDQSTAFQKDLLSLARTAPDKRKADAMDKCIKFLAGRNIATAKCRLMCLSDATGSMSGVWKQSQESIRTMLERIAGIAGAGNIEVKWVAFRDYDVRKSKVLECSSWTDDPASLVKFVGGIQCMGGDDYPEAVEAALHYANHDPDPPTRVLLIGDAPPHREEKGSKISGLTVHPSNQEPGGYVPNGVLLTDYRVESANLQSKGIKVFPFYLDTMVKPTFEEIAKLTGGEAKLMDVGDRESLIHAVCETALEDIGGATMQEKYRAQYRS